MNASAQAQTHEFQAEVKQVLDIVVHSLYTDKEIFVRELVSNASDALEKLRHIQVTEKTIYDEELPLEISISSDDQANTITIQDFGIGMTEEELIENLGRIAHSGSKAFLEAIKKEGATNENLIGQFGVGFYSVFMVAEEVRVFTHSWKPEAQGYCWKSDGSGSYSIEPAEGQRRGTKIVISLKDEYKEFASSDRIKAILERYSSFVPFPVSLNGDSINAVQALWLKNKNEIKDDEYVEFYKFQAKAFDEPQAWMHFSADAPLAINALLFVPGENMERFGFGRMEPGVALYCRKVLIDPSPKELLPEWMRFVKGVIDSADLPLNISRENMQDSALMQKLGAVVTKRFLKFLNEMASKEVEKYESFWKGFSVFLKEGATMDFANREALSKLLRFESSAKDKGTLVSFEDYVSRMPEGQKDIYFVNGTSRESIEAGPYLEAFKAREIEVLFCYEPIDDFVMNHLGSFSEKRLVSIDQNDIQLDAVESSDESDSLSEEDSKALCEWIKETLGENVSEVSVGNRLVKSPAIVLNADAMMNANMRRMMQAMQGEEASGLKAKVNLQINPHHVLLKNLTSLKERDTELAKQVARQIFDSAMVSAGLLEDPQEMVQRMYGLLETVSK